IMEMMDHEVGNMSRLVDDLLDLSRITRGKIQLRKETVDLGSIIAHSVDMVRPLLEAQRHQLAVSLPREPVHLEPMPPAWSKCWPISSPTPPSTPSGAGVSS